MVLDWIPKFCLLLETLYCDLLEDLIVVYCEANSWVFGFWCIGVALGIKTNFLIKLWGFMWFDIGECSCQVFYVFSRIGLGRVMNFFTATKHFYVIIYLYATIEKLYFFGIKYWMKIIWKTQVKVESKSLSLKELSLELKFSDVYLLFWATNWLAYLRQLVCHLHQNFITFITIPRFYWDAILSLKSEISRYIIN